MMDNVPRVTKNLILINVIMFFATMINEDLMIRWFALFYPSSQYFHWWQFITHMFMHGGFWHILFNMYTLVMFGMVVERALGSRRFLILFFVTGFGAVLLHTGVEYLQVRSLVNEYTPVPYSAQQIYDMIPHVLGASGAVYGVLVAFAMLYPQARMTLLFPPVTLDAKWMVAIFIGIELLTGITGTQMGVAHFAHLGGALFGFLLVWYWRKSGKLWRR
jgi:membrane associated rhomboid family serine protease